MVQRRRLIDAAEAIGNRRLVVAKHAAGSRNPQPVQAVSYTHLDVYKRQGRVEIPQEAFLAVLKVGQGDEEE